jgi:hypothetical protein
MLISHFMGYQAGYAQQVLLIQISLGSAGYEATNASFSNFIGLTLVKTQQTLVNQLCYRWL